MFNYIEDVAFFLDSPEFGLIPGTTKYLVSNLKIRSPPFSLPNFCACKLGVLVLLSFLWFSVPYLGAVPNNSSIVSDVEFLSSAALLGLLYGTYGRIRWVQLFRAHFTSLWSDSPKRDSIFRFTAHGCVSFKWRKFVARISSQLLCGYVLPTATKVSFFVSI